MKIHLTKFGGATTAQGHMVLCGRYVPLSAQQPAERPIAPIVMPAACVTCQNVAKIRLEKMRLNKDLLKSA